MYSSRPNLVLGFHGCEKSEQQRLLSDPEYFRKSTQDYDWLGHGMYFWENNPQRAWDWANQKQKAGNLDEPAVIGAVIDLGYCLDLLDAKNIELVKESFFLFSEENAKLSKSIPQNVDHRKDPNKDKLLRYLDCAVIEYTHQFFKENKEKPFDSVRAVFIEGKPIYPDAGFYEKSHIQIAIINPNCIKGFFLTRELVKGSNPV